MPVDYDLVILGGTPEGRLAANVAATTGARVALVEPHHRWQRLTFAQYLQTGLRYPIQSDWQRLHAWVTLATDRQASSLSLAALAAQGVDVICGEGQFQPSPNPHRHPEKRPRFDVNQRQLFSRGYLIASGSSPDLSEMGVGQQDWVLTPERVALLDHLPEQIALLGAHGTTVEWATAFAKMGVRVIVVLAKDQFLPAEDSDIQRLVFQQMMTLGVQFIPQGQIHHIQALSENQWQLALADQTIEVEALILPDNCQPNVTGLGLEAVGVRPSPRGLRVNDKLQTTHPRIYAIGSVLGGESCPEIALQELQVAVHNALFWNQHRVSYSTMAYGLWGPNEMGHAGLTERQARQIYGDSIQILQSSQVPTLAQADYDLAFCKLIVREEGQLMGGHLIGPRARTLAADLEPYLARKGAIAQLAIRGSVPDTLATVLQQTAAQLIQDRWTIGHWRRDWAENWFNYRRSR